MGENKLGKINDKMVATAKLSKCKPPAEIIRVLEIVQIY